jgi:hypothetical protein
MQVDKGAEFQSNVLDAWAFAHGIKLVNHPVGVACRNAA